MLHVWSNSLSATFQAHQPSLKKCGKGWNNTNINNYFTLKKPDDDSDEDSNNEVSAEEVRGKQKGIDKSKQGYMTASKQFEAHHIILWMMRMILLTKGGKIVTRIISYI